MRDIIHYSNDNNIHGAVLSLDWSKAYDRVDHNFLYRALRKLGFNDRFIDIIKIFTSNLESTVQLNGNLIETFSIGRGIRQGCPLSMMLYVLFKEALYCYIKSKNSIKGPHLPNGYSFKILGFADDTNLFLRDNNSILEAMNILYKFEKATGAKLNREKTKIYGIGAWNGRVEWPLPWIKSSTQSIKSLGIIYSNNYNSSINL